MGVSGHPTLPGVGHDELPTEDGGEASHVRPRRSTLVEPGALVADKYRLVAPLGQGAMGDVWTALHVLLGRRVALKILHRDRLGDALGRERFRREALAVGALQHPGIVQPLDFGTLPDGREYLAMELVEGPTLSTVLQQRGPLPWREVVRIAIDVVEALAHAHDHGIIHRDIKPANLAIEAGDVRQGRTRLLDLGIARRQSVSPGRTLTQQGMVLGTPRFASPEQLRADEVGPRADLYSLGAVAYLALSGRYPFEGETFAQIAEAQKRADPLPLREVAPDSDRPAALDRLIASLLARDPMDRPGSAAEVRRRLETLQGASGRGPLGPWSVALAAAGLGLALAGLATAVWVAASLAGG